LKTITNQYLLNFCIFQTCCYFCGLQSVFFSVIDRHILDAHTCLECGRRLPDPSMHHNCQRMQYGGGRNPINPHPWELTQEAHLGLFRVYRLLVNDDDVDGVSELFFKYEQEIRELIIKILQAQGGSRIQLKYLVDLVKEATDEIRENIYLDGIFHIILHSSSIDEILFSSITNIIEQLNIFSNNGSGWSLKNIKVLFIESAQYAPLRGAAVPKVFKLPPEIAKKRGLFNIKCYRDECFKYSIACSYLKFSTKRKAEKMVSYRDFFRQNEIEKIIDFSELPTNIVYVLLYFFYEENKIFCKVAKIKDGRFSVCSLYSYH